MKNREISPEGSDFQPGMKLAQSLVEISTPRFSFSTHGLTHYELHVFSSREQVGVRSESNLSLHYLKNLCFSYATVMVHCER